MKSFLKIFGAVLLGIVMLCSLIGIVLFGAAGIIEVINGLLAINTELATGFAFCLLAWGSSCLFDLCGDIVCNLKKKME